MQSSSRKTLILSFCLLACLTLILGGFILLQSAAAQQAAPDTPTPTIAQVIPKQDIPGDTTVLLIAAAGLIVIAVGGIAWRSRNS